MFLYTSFFLYSSIHISLPLALYIHMYICIYIYTYIFGLTFLLLLINSEVECAAGLDLGSPHPLVSVRIAASHLLEKKALLCVSEWKL